MTARELTKVLIVDELSIVRDGLESIFEGTDDFEVVGQAANASEAVCRSRSLNPDLIIMDVVMPLRDGIDACREILREMPHIRILILTASQADDALVQSVAAGARGYLPKHSGKENLLNTAREVAAGEFRIPGDAATRLFTQVRDGSIQQDGPELMGLTATQQQILRMYSTGKSYAQIAEARGNKPLTIRNTIYRIQNKLHLNTKQELVVWAVRNGLLDDRSTQM